MCAQTGKGVPPEPFVVQGDTIYNHMIYMNRKECILSFFMPDPPVARPKYTNGKRHGNRNVETCLPLAPLWYTEYAEPASVRPALCWDRIKGVAHCG